MRCIIVDCERKATTRGLCHSCYITALRLIQADETTWESLESASLCGPLMRAPNAFAKAYTKRLADLPGQQKLFSEEESNEMPNT